MRRLFCVALAVVLLGCFAAPGQAQNFTSPGNATALQGKPVSSTAPVSSQVLAWVVSGPSGAWTPKDVSALLPQALGPSASPTFGGETLTVLPTWPTQTANQVWASLDGGTGSPSFRALTANDIPGLNVSKLTAGTLGIVRGGTGIASVTTGDILYASGTNALSVLAKSTDGFVLELVSGLPAWATPPSTSLQGAYGAGAAIATTAAQTITFSNGVDTTDLFTLSRTFSGGGKGIAMVMAAGTTGTGINIVESGSGFALQTSGSGTVSLSDTAADNFTVLGVTKNPSGAQSGNCATFTLGANTTGNGLSVSKANGATGASLSLFGSSTSQFIESTDGSTSAPSGAATGRLRYNNTAAAWQTSVQTGAWASLLVSGGLVASDLGVASVASGAFLGGPNGSTGAASFRTILASDLPAPTITSNMLDAVFGGVRGSMLERGASGWTAVVPGVTNYVWTSGGGGADPSWQAASGGGGAALNPTTSIITLGIGLAATQVVGPSDAVFVQSGGASKAFEIKDGYGRSTLTLGNASGTQFDITDANTRIRMNNSVAYLYNTGWNNFFQLNSNGSLEVSSGSQDLTLEINGGSPIFRVDRNGSVVANARGSVLAQSSTDGCLYVPRFGTGAPTGVPTAITGGAAMGVGGDHHLYCELTTGTMSQIDGAGAVTNLQTAYAGGNAIAVSSGNSVTLSNAANSTDNLTISHTFAGSGQGEQITMGASATGTALGISVAGTSSPLIITTTASSSPTQINGGGNGSQPTFYVTRLPNVGAPTDTGLGISLDTGTYTTGTSLQITNEGTGAGMTITTSNANPAAMISLTENSGGLNVSAPLISGTQNWNNAGVTFTALKANITNSASGDLSMLLDLQIGGASQFSVTKAGDAMFGASNRQTGQTGNDTNVVTVTTGAVDASYEVSPNIYISSTAVGLTATVTYTPETGGAISQAIPFVNLAGSTVTTLTTAGAYEGVVMRIRCKASTTIVVSTAITSGTYNVEAGIRRVKG